MFQTSSSSSRRSRLGIATVTVLNKSEYWIAIAIILPDKTAACDFLPIVAGVYMLLPIPPNPELFSR